MSFFHWIIVMIKGENRCKAAGLSTHLQQQFSLVNIIIIIFSQYVWNIYERTDAI